MKKDKMVLPELKIGKLTSRYPIIQGGMGVGVSMSRLSSAVSNAGGIGIIASVALGINSRHFTGPPSYPEANMKALKDEIDTAMRHSPIGNIGTNCMVAITDYENMVRTSLENGAKIIISGAGLPLQLPEYAADFPDVALVPIVSSVKAASILFRRWETRNNRIPDAFVVETPRTAGGHLGTCREEVELNEYSLERVVPELKETLTGKFRTDIPVIAAGGIWDRKDIDWVFSLGGDGVQMATRFACTEECDAPPEFKEMLINAGEEDVVLVKSPVGLPGRGVSSKLVNRLEKEDSIGDGVCLYNCLKRCSYREEGKGFCIASALVNAQRGSREEGLFFAGSNVFRCKEITTVSKIFKELTGELEVSSV